MCLMANNEYIFCPLLKFASIIFEVIINIYVFILS